MTSYEALRLAHLLSAVLGAGTVAGVAVAARHVARSPTSLASSSLAPLLRWASVGLALTLLTGIAIDLTTSGAFREQWWFRLAALSTIAAGVLLGMMRGRVRRAESGTPGALASLPWLAYGAFAIVAWAIVLMEVRPFR
jgi:hypothetical protein